MSLVFFSKEIPCKLFCIANKYLVINWRPFLLITYLNHYPHFNLKLINFCIQWAVTEEAIVIYLCIYCNIPHYFNKYLWNSCIGLLVKGSEWKCGRYTSFSLSVMSTFYTEFSQFTNCATVTFFFNFVYLFFVFLSFLALGWGQRTFKY